MGSGSRGSVVVLRDDERVPRGHLAAEGGAEGGLLCARVGLVLLRRGARVRVLSASEVAVTLPR